MEYCLAVKKILNFKIMEYFNLISTEEYSKILEKIKNDISLHSEIIPLDNSYYRYCSGDIFSNTCLPGFRRSQVDGYATISKDTYSASSAPVYLKCLGNLAVNEDVSSKSINPGECYRISTGGMVPNGADSIVMIEHTNLVDENTVEVLKPVSPMENIIKEDEDVKTGEKILSVGDIITTYHIGLLASLGISEIEVFKKIDVSIISTGDEIVNITEKISPGKIRDVNSHTLLSLCKRYGTNPKILGIVEDNAKKIYEKLKLALDKSNLVLISGGSSVGTRDLTLEVIDRFANSKILFHGIAIKPGKPTIMAKIENKFIFGLPGQVSSSIVSFFLTVLPLIKQLYKNNNSLPFINAIAGINIKSTLGREEWVKSKIKYKNEKNDSTFTVYPVYSKSGVLGSFTKSDGFTIIPANREGIKAGENCRFLPYNLIL